MWSCNCKDKVQSDSIDQCRTCKSMKPTGYIIKSESPQFVSAEKQNREEAKKRTAKKTRKNIKDAQKLPQKSEFLTSTFFKKKEKGK